MRRRTFLTAAASTAMVPGFPGRSMGGAHPSSAPRDGLRGRLASEGSPWSSCATAIGANSTSFWNSSTSTWSTTSSADSCAPPTMTAVHFNTHKTATNGGTGASGATRSSYNHNLARSDKYLGYARRSVDFIMKIPSLRHRLLAGNLRAGRRGHGQKAGSLPGDCYIAEGLAEFSRATGERKMRGSGPGDPAQMPRKV